MDIQGKKVAVLHAFLLFFGGGERLIMDLARHLKADFYTGFMSRDFADQLKDGPYDPATFPVKVLHKEANIPVWRHVKRQIFLNFRTRFLKQYDVVIYSGNCVSAIFNTRKDAKNVLYCHTPVRLAYDQYDTYMKNQSWWRKPLFWVFVRIVRFMYQISVNRMDVIVSNSEIIQQRVKKYLGKESVVVYPPTDLSRFHWEEPRDFYLSTARVDDLKRVEVIAKAFQGMPKKKLVIISSGSKSDEVAELVKGYENIEMLGRVSDAKLEELMATCITSIYIPRAEDFGMSPIESMAAGKPPIVANDGFLPYSVKDRETGYVCPKEVTPEDLQEAVRWMTPERAVAMRPACEERAKLYSKEAFLQGMDEVIGKL